MKRHYINHFCVVAMLLLTTISAKAQYTIEISEPEKGDYSTTNTAYSLSDIAAMLEVSTDELVQGLTTWASNNYGGNPEFFALADAEGKTLSTTHSANDGGYYMDAGGSLSYWGNGAPWYVQLDWDEEDGELYIMIGQNASIKLNVGDSYHGYVAINLNAKQVLFEMSYTIVEREGLNVEPVPYLSQITVVGRSTFEAEQQPNNAWYRHYYTMSVKGMADALGIDPEYLAANMRDIIYAKSYDSTYENFGDQLVNTLTATPTPGFWFGTGVLLEGEEEESDELQHASYGSSDKFWVADIQYFADDSLYFCMGKETIEAERDSRKGYEPDIFAVNTTELFSLLGAESILDIRVATNDQYGNLTDAYTADTTGFWFRPTGEVTSYSTGRTSFYIDYVDSIPAFAVGNMPDAFVGGEECTATLYFICGEKYYEYDFKFTIQKPQYTIEDCEITEMDLTVNFIPTASGGAWEIGQTDMTPYEEVLGTDKGVFYGLDAEGNLTNTYSVTEASQGGGGFWMSPEDEDHYAYAASYRNGDDGFGAFAVWYYESQIHWYNCPGRRNPGEYSTAVFYIFNLWDGKGLKLNTTIKFVDEIITEVGEMEILLPARDKESGDDMAETDVDLSEMYTALGCTAEEFEAQGIWGVLNADSVIISREKAIELDAYDEIQGFPITAEGLLETEDVASAYCYVDFIDGRFVSYTSDDANIDNPCIVTFYARYGNKIYKVNTIVSQSIPVGIHTLAGNANTDSRIYNLAGQRMNTLQRGLNIVGGKKVLVK